MFRNKKTNVMNLVGATWLNALRNMGGPIKLIMKYGKNRKLRGASGKMPVVPGLEKW
jgi:hypothetical protein